MCEKEIKRDTEFRIYPFVKYKKWDLFPWPCMVESPEKHFQRVKGFNSRDDDIIFTTAMKSGTHWLHEILSMLVDQTTEYNSRMASYDIELDYVTDYTELENSKRTRILHTHLPYSFLPEKHIENKCKVVYLNRNPKDRHVSQYVFFKRLVGFPDWDWDTYFKEMVMKVHFIYKKEIANGKHRLGKASISYFGHEIIV